MSIVGVGLTRCYTYFRQEPDSIMMHSATLGCSGLSVCMTDLSVCSAPLHPGRKPVRLQADPGSVMSSLSVCKRIPVLDQSRHRPRHLGPDGDEKVWPQSRVSAKKCRSKPQTKKNKM
eukprot:4336295-Amphidinium_carterae.1